MKSVCTMSMDSDNSKTIAREIFTRKNLKILISAKMLRFAKKGHPKPFKEYNSDKRCHFWSERAYHHTESVKANVSTNEIEKKVKVLETIVTEMAKKVVKLEAELITSKMVKNQVKIQMKINLLLKGAMKLKNPAYGRQSISRPMRIVAPMP